MKAASKAKSIPSGLPAQPRATKRARVAADAQPKPAAKPAARTAASGAPAPRKRRSLASAGKAQAGKGFHPLKQVLWSRPGFLVRRLHQIHDALFFSECQTHNITPMQYGILTALSLNPWLDQTAVGHELALDRTTTADVLKRLEEKGLIERRVNPDDRRSRLSVITKSGLQTMNDLYQGMHSAQQRLLAPLSEMNRIAFLKLLSVLIEAHENVDQEES
jgi:DNA-binding MarR family transcriptional regulator